MSDKPPAIVIKLDCVTGLQAARTLSGHGIPVYGIADNADHFSCRTNSCEQILVSDTSNYDLIDTLINLGKRLRKKSVLFPCSDESVHMISLHRDELAEWFDFVIPDHNTKDIFSDKIKFYRYAERENLPIPLTLYPKRESDLTEIIDKIEFPCIIKPAIKTPLWYGTFRSKVLKINSTEELRRMYESISKVTDSPVVQQLIEGKDSNLRSCTFYYNRQSEPVILFTSKKIRQWPPDFGEICIGEEIRDDEVLRYTTKLLHGIEFKGVGSLELKNNEADGLRYMIEANVGRLPLRFGLVEAGGVELLYTMYLDALGINVETKTQQKYSNAKLIYC